MLTKCVEKTIEKGSPDCKTIVVTETTSKNIFGDSPLGEKHMSEITFAFCFIGFMFPFQMKVAYTTLIFLGLYVFYQRRRQLTPSLDRRDFLQDPLVKGIIVFFLLFLFFKINNEN